MLYKSQKCYFNSQRNAKNIKFLCPIFYKKQKNLCASKWRHNQFTNPSDAWHFWATKFARKLTRRRNGKSCDAVAAAAPARVCLAQNVQFKNNALQCIEIQRFLNYGVANKHELHTVVVCCCGVACTSYVSL